MIDKFVRFKYLIVFVFLLTACSEERQKISEIKVIKPNKFKSYFKVKKNPYTIKSNQIKNEIDSQKLSPELIKQFIPEKFIGYFPELVNTKNNTYPLFYFENEKDEWYLLLVVEIKDKYKIYVCYFDENNKIKSVGYIDYFSKKVVNEPIQITITKEPTFVLKGYHSTQINNSYSKSFDFIEDSFCVIVEEYSSLKDLPLILDTNQKIDLNASKNFYCGEYFFKNNKLILSDGENNFSYNFMLSSTFKNNCPLLVISGIFDLKKNKGEYQLPNVTCKITFSISNNIISVREVGKCRGKKDYPCNFTGTYSLNKNRQNETSTKLLPKTPPSKKIKKTNKPTTSKSNSTATPKPSKPNPDVSPKTKKSKPIVSPKTKKSKPIVSPKTKKSKPQPAKSTTTTSKNSKKDLKKPQQKNTTPNKANKTKDQNIKNQPKATLPKKS